MYVRCIIRKTAQLYGIVLENRREPEEGGSHRTIANPVLSQFISKLGEHGMPLYKLLQKADGFQWDD
jgi:hypothetical protein